MPFASSKTLSTFLPFLRQVKLRKMPIFKESWKMATTIVRRSSVSLSSGSKMSFLQLHSHPYALYLRRSHIPICVDNLTSYRPKNFLRLLFELLSVNKEFEEVTSNTCFICCFFWLWLGKKRLLLLLSLSLTLCFSFVKSFSSNLRASVRKWKNSLPKM